MGQAWGTLMPLGGCRRPPPAFAASLLRYLPQVSSSVCGRPSSTSAADLFRCLRQTSDDLCGRPWSISAAEVGGCLRQTSGEVIYPSVLSLLFHELDRPSHIFWRIDADGFLMGDANLYPIAVLQPAQLFQALGFFQFRLG